MHERVLLVSTIDRFTLQLARAAVLAGYAPFVVTDRRFGIDRLSVHARRRLVLDHAALVEGTAESIGRINDFIERHRIDLVIPGDTRCTRMLARAGGALRGAALFPIPPPELFDRLYDKGQLAELLESLGLPRPRTRVVRSPEEEVDLEYPIIIKPTWGESGVGIERIDDPEVLRRRLRRVDGAVPVLVQEWLPGFDIDLDLCADHGELTAWLVQVREARGVRFVEDERVVALGRALCRAVGYHGIGHIDMRVDARTGEVVIIEFNPRVWGSLLDACWMGVNFLSAGAALLSPASGAVERTHPLGMCPPLGATPGAIARWVWRGFHPPGSLPAHHRAWRMQLGDPLPEWFDWARVKAAAALRAVPGRRGGPDASCAG